MTVCGWIDILILWWGPTTQADAKEFGGFAPMKEHTFVLTLSQPELASTVEVGPHHHGRFVLLCHFLIHPPRFDINPIVS